MGPAQAGGVDITAWPLGTATCSAQLHLGGLRHVSDQACSGPAQPRPSSPHAPQHRLAPKLLRTPSGLPPGLPTAPALVPGRGAWSVCAHRPWVCMQCAEALAQPCRNKRCMVSRLHRRPGTHTQPLPYSVNTAARTPEHAWSTCVHTYPRTQADTVGTHTQLQTHGCGHSVPLNGQGRTGDSG